MFVYRETANTFIETCKCLNDKGECNEIADQIKLGLIRSGLDLGDENTSIAKSWKLSLPKIAEVLKATKIDLNSEVAIEYKPHQTRERIDFLISGKDNLGNKNLLIIELKQWSTVQKSKLDACIFANTFGTKYEDKWHPSYQAYNYGKTIKNFNVNVRKIPINIITCSYLHNLDDKNSAKILKDTEIFPIVKSASKCFIKEDVDELINFINQYVPKECNDILYEMENSEIVPSRYLGNMFHEAIKGTEFNSLDEGQRMAISTIIKKVRDAKWYNIKSCLIIKGGAGTGKSVVALNVLGQLLYPQKSKFRDIKNEFEKPDTRLNVAYFTTNGAPRYYMEHELTKEKYSKMILKALFKNPTCLKNSRENDFDCGLFDEAHRIFEFKGGVGIKKDDHIFEQTIKACKVSVFFIDEDQMVTKDDYATIEKIMHMARKYHALPQDVGKLELTSQFRCSGGEEYISFVKSILGYEGYNTKYRINSKHYDFRIFKSAKDMFEEIKRRDAEEIEKTLNDKGVLVDDHTISGKCRTLAGYTREWISKGKGRDSNLFDFNIEDNINGKKTSLIAKWNLRPGGDYCYIADPLSVNEIGCIHTVQGLDLNYAGVIITKDVSVNNGKLVFDRNLHLKAHDLAMASTTDEDICKKIIRNTFHVLLTRGVKGTYIYCENEDVRKFIEDRILNLDHYG